MNVDTMRKIDYYVGLPLTWLFTLLIKGIELFKTPKIIQPKNILFIELSEMGSTIIADPALRKARQHFNAKLFFVIFARNKVSLTLLNTIPEQQIFTIREDNLFTFAIDIVRFMVWARQQKIDSCIDLELFSRATALLSVLSGAQNRVGFDAFHKEGLSRGRLLTHRVAYNNHIHMAKNFIALVNALISNNQEVPYSKTFISDEEIKLTQAVVTAAQIRFIHEKIQSLFPSYNAEENDLILINPNASELLPQRRWPKEHFQKLIELILHDYPKALILITGAPAERAEADVLTVAVNNPRCINFAGQVKFVELIPLYFAAKLMVTNDSGPGHFSAITPLATIVLFGPETPRLYGSLGNSTALFLGLACSPCVSAANHRKTPCQNNVCMQLMEPLSVMSEVKKRLS